MDVEVAVMALVVVVVVLVGGAGDTGFISLLCATETSIIGRCTGHLPTCSRDRTTIFVLLDYCFRHEVSRTYPLLRRKLG